jgi:hypothetical protein
LHNHLGKYMTDEAEQEEAKLDSLGLPEGHGLEISSLNGEDIKDALMLGSIIHQITGEIAESKELIVLERKRHSELNYKLVCGKTAINSLKRLVKDIKAKMPRHRDQLNTLRNWFDVDVKRLIEKESNRQNILIRSVTELLAQLGNICRDRKNVAKEVSNFNSEIRCKLDELEKEKKLTETEANWISLSIATLLETLNTLHTSVESQKDTKANIIKVRYDNEMRVRKHELSLMAAALQKRLQQGGTCKNMNELDVVALDGKELKKMPQLLSKLKNAKIISLANNDLLAADGITDLKSLLSLNLNVFLNDCREICLTV